MSNYYSVIASLRSNPEYIHVQLVCFALLAKTKPAYDRAKSEEVLSAAARMYE